MAGGKRGNKGGTGRTPKEMRDKMRYSLAQRIWIAEQIADDESASNRDRMQALEFLARYGLGTTITETDTEGNDAAQRFTFVIDSPIVDSDN